MVKRVSDAYPEQVELANARAVVTKISERCLGSPFSCMEDYFFMTLSYPSLVFIAGHLWTGIRLYKTKFSFLL